MILKRSSRTRGYRQRPNAKDDTRKTRAVPTIATTILAPRPPSRNPGDIARVRLCCTPPLRRSSARAGEGAFYGLWLRLDSGEEES